MQHPDTLPTTPAELPARHTERIIMAPNQYGPHALETYAANHPVFLLRLRPEQTTAPGLLADLQAVASREELERMPASGPTRAQLVADRVVRPLDAERWPTVEI